MSLWYCIGAEPSESLGSCWTQLCLCFSLLTSLPVFYSLVLLKYTFLPQWLSPFAFILPQHSPSYLQVLAVYSQSLCHYCATMSDLRSTQDPWERFSGASNPKHILPPWMYNSLINHILLGPNATVLLCLSKSYKKGKDYFSFTHWRISLRFESAIYGCLSHKKHWHHQIRLVTAGDPMVA